MLLKNKQLCDLAQMFHHIKHMVTNYVSYGPHHPTLLLIQFLFSSLINLFKSLTFGISEPNFFLKVHNCKIIFNSRRFDLILLAGLHYMLCMFEVYLFYFQ